ncbi:MAG: HAMP domain-containing protein [Planctomycetes bacterium]|nr:HAMP domain-containing protein [Planctomycetota bacterium]
MRGLGLATKITVPFVLLFSLLLVALGVVLASEIFKEIEARVEREQTFVLAVASDPRMPRGEASLRAIKRSATGDEGERGPELIAMEEHTSPSTTLDLAKEEGAALLKDLAKAAKEPERFPGLHGAEAGERIGSTHATLAGQKYLVLYIARPGRVPGEALRDYFLIYPQANIEAVQQRALARIAGFGACGLLLAALLGRLVAHWITRPIKRLATAAGRLASGGLNEPFEHDAEKARDEIGELARAFGAMVESLRASQHELVKAERLAATGKLAASVAHEIRNPLTSLRMTVQMLAEKAEKRGDASDREAYQVILGEIDRLALSVEELLTFARPRPAQRAPADLNLLVQDTVKFLGRQLQHARVQARVEPDAGLPADFAFDANKVRQLLVNLVLNAMQAIVREGTVTIRTRWDAVRRAATLEVADTGPGIPQEIRDKAFDPFVSTKPGGGGLGLAIAKQIAEEHAGAIRFETGKTGTTFFVTLPAG